MKRLTMMMLGLMAVVMGMKAQVGYQIALLNTATGEARANETVTVSVTLSNSEGTAFYSETKQAITNDFGVLNLTIGNADTFTNVDFSKMPFFIEVSANGTLIGKSQILSVPLAEVAKKVAPIDKGLIVGTWRTSSSDLATFSLNSSGSVQVTVKSYRDNEPDRVYSGTYEIEGSEIFCYMNGAAYSEGMVVHRYKYHNGQLVGDTYYGNLSKVTN